MTVLTAVACEKSDRHFARGPFNRAPATPDEMPALVSTELPFHYPAVLYARRVQANVMLRLFVDADGRVVVDSTRVTEPSGYPSLDSAALAGAGDLRFAPAKLHGSPTPTSILFPVYFRHPEARPLAGDTILTAAATKAE
ncbi:MAG TPA: energy transducer TonB [Gemmatimonadaceae bacterium]|jgi:TonB family protein